MNERATTTTDDSYYYTPRRENFPRPRRKESREEILEKKKNGTRCEYRSSERGGVSTAIRCVFARIRFFFFPSLSNSLSNQILSVRSFSLSFSLLLLLLSPDDDRLSVLRCCVWRNVGCRRLFAVSEKRKRIYMGGGFHLR